MNKDEWVKALIKIDDKSDCKHERYEAGVVFYNNVLEALYSSNVSGVKELVNRMNANPLKSVSVIGMLEQWNTSGHPIRDFLITRLIDYPDCN